MEKKRRKNLKYYFIAGGVSLAVAIGIFCLFFFLRAKEHGYGLINWLDSMSYTGIIVVSLGGLMWVTNEGFFDIFAYGFKQLGGAMFNKNPTVYNDFPGYKDYKKANRKASPKIFISVLIVAGAILIAALVLYLVYVSKR